MNQHTDIRLSFVVPLFQEGPGLERFYDRLSGAADDLGEPYEILFVCDGASDPTVSVARRLADDDFRVRVIELSRTFGRPAAAAAGQDYAAGEAVLLLDADGRHPPEAVSQLVARWREGFEFVTARPDDAAPRRRGPLGRLFGRYLQRDGIEALDFCLLSRKVVETLRRAPEPVRRSAGMLEWMGFRRTSVTYQPGQGQAARRRHAAAAEPPPSPAPLNLALGPLRALPLAGGGLLIAAAGYALVALVLWAFGAAPSATASLIMLLVGFSGVHLAAMGLVGAYVARLYQAQRVRPLYVVSETVGFPAEPEAAETPGHPAAVGEAEKPITIFT